MITTFLAAAIVAGTPLLFAILGEILTEKSGELNLGVEGMMLLGAVAGFGAGYSTGNPLIAIVCAMAAGGAGALIFGLLTVTFKANQVVTGLTLTIFGTGLSGFIGKRYVGERVPDAIREFFGNYNIPFLEKIPFAGEIFFQQTVFVYFGYIAAVLAGIYIYQTRFGLNLRAVGENSGAADASGINVTLYKYIHIIIGGAFAGAGGAYLSLVYVPAWQENLTAGRGWIAVALVIFCRWNPYYVCIGAFIFGGLDILGFRLQKYPQIEISPYLIDMLPYIATIVIIILTSVRKKRENMPPSSLGEPYFREER